ncbi:MAG: toll/interleukin-1 receptor domain-containing protein [Nitrospirae bacterium]|nr:toll/interleukin-1 receptor domain-containing protein [Nitrospirota bacterium]
MTEEKKIKSAPEAVDAPLVFISHDSRDADLAEAFSKLLKSVSAGMLKSFRSSDKKGAEGIDFGDEWYKRLMSKLESASDVVCLLTERSLDRPWILYEAGVAKGKMETPVHGVALGVPLSRVSTGPFYQFQNSDDSDDSLIKLVLQLCRRVDGLEPDEDVVKAQVEVFKKRCEEVLKKLSTSKKQEKQEPVDEGAVAKVLEEMKLLVRELPSRIEQRVIERPDREKRRIRRFHPMMIEDMIHRFSRRSGDPIGLLIISSLVRDEFPWLYEIGLEAYRAAKSGSIDEIQDALRIFHEAYDFTLHGPFIDEMGMLQKEAHMMLRELPMIIDHYMHFLMEHPPRMKVERISPRRLKDKKNPVNTNKK